MTSEAHSVPAVLDGLKRALDTVRENEDQLIQDATSGSEDALEHSNYRHTESVADLCELLEAFLKDDPYSDLLKQIEAQQDIIKELQARLRDRSEDAGFTLQQALNGGEFRARLPQFGPEEFICQNEDGIMANEQGRYIIGMFYNPRVIQQWFARTDWERMSEPEKVNAP